MFFCNLCHSLQMVTDCDVRVCCYKNRVREDDLIIASSFSDVSEASLLHRHVLNCDCDCVTVLIANLSLEPIGESDLNLTSWTEEYKIRCTFEESNWSIAARRLVSLKIAKGTPEEGNERLCKTAIRSSLMVGAFQGQNQAVLSCCVKCKCCCICVANERERFDCHE